jgi:hypothetical protein
MYEVTAHAVRIGSAVEVTVIGFLATSCHQAKISDVYPGGNIVYIKDPGSAQVFIEEFVQVGTIYCAMVLIPWVATTIIADDTHTTVSVFINKRKELEVPIEEKSKAQFIVVQLTGGIIPNGDFSIIPAKALYPSIYTMVFGPDTYSMCDQWINEQTPFQFLDAVAVGYGGGGGAPHGFGNGGGGGMPHGLKAILKSNEGRSGNPRGLEVEAFKTKK